MKRWEYRNIHLLLAPVYVQMIGWCLRYRVTPFGLLKADYALDHGGATFASKFDIQMTFPQDRFPPTMLVREAQTKAERAASIVEFAGQVGFPIIAKPDLGRVGYGVTLIHDVEQVERFLDRVSADYIVQQFVEGPLEFGVFYVRKGGVADVFAINSKDFPAVTGDGKRSVRELLARDERLARFADLFNTGGFELVPGAGETVALSNIGSHTLGCVFKDATDLKTPELVDAIHQAIGVPGFQYGRLDVRCASVEALRKGRFTVIEVNGVESLATNAFDPEFSYGQGLRWFSRQFRLLVEIAAENRRQSMDRVSTFEFFRRVAHAEQDINRLGSLMHLSSAQGHATESGRKAG